MEVTVKVSSITPAAAAALEGMLSRWAARALAQPHAHGEPLIAGSIGVRVELSADDQAQQQQQGQQQQEDGQEGGASVRAHGRAPPTRVLWVDTLKPMPAPDGGAPNGGDGTPAAPPPARHERGTTPPAYERGCDEMLSEAPGLDAAAAGMEAAAPEPWVGAVLAAAPGGAAATAPESPTPKRRRLSSSRCFNCGAYSHTQAQCWRPHDPARAGAAAAELRAARGPAAAGGGEVARYFSLTAAELLARSYPDARPGAVSGKLASALGMLGPGAPPPWLARMLVLGVPPAYSASPAAPTAARASSLDAASARGIQIISGDGDGDGGGGANGASPAAADGAEASGEGDAAAAEAAGNSAAAPSPDAAAEAAGAAQGEAAAAGEAATVEGAAAAEEAAAAPAPAPAPAPPAAAAVAFPGVNAPFPADADARLWQRALTEAYIAMGAEQAERHQRSLLAAADAAAAGQGGAQQAAAAEPAAAAASSAGEGVAAKQQREDGGGQAQGEVAQAANGPGSKAAEGEDNMEVEGAAAAADGAAAAAGGEPEAVAAAAAGDGEARAEAAAAGGGES
ncbi:hypothetical protein Rsub_00046 [Raphidocelis subcapitata]|uniref:PSP proline-rich domain-containing protein n=1 Tax=Raphidocelis subcapitata TaxID=307507 RepID=A0A2V0NR70_9CHLO|nr:hypothetical protein Rsub_00046 [Raphidocelis subcapitata]|eukprot:GBF87335.1 hypothetical protein Rsub_00046 [Raphidocelis subcapitata]